MVWSFSDRVYGLSPQPGREQTDEDDGGPGAGQLLQHLHPHGPRQEGQDHAGVGQGEPDQHGLLWLDRTARNVTIFV